MKLTKELRDFVEEVANAAVSEENSDVTFDDCVVEYTDQIVNDDYFCVVCYAVYKDIVVPQSLKEGLRKD